MAEPITVDESTPSPVSKPDGSNKRVLTNQGQSSTIRKQPAATPEGSGGLDGNEGNNPNPNHNPNP